MSVHIVRSYDDALGVLSGDIARMGGLTEALVNDAILSVTRRDTRLAQEIIPRNSRINAAQKAVEKRCTSMLALRQPMAADMREVIAAWKIALDLERVGDLAKNTATRTLALNQCDPIQLTRSIEPIGKMAASHLTQVLDAYNARDAARAVAIWSRDEDIDAHYNALFRELLTYMMEDPRTISPCTHLLFVAKSIERIGDHCARIAEAVHLLVTGQEISSERRRPMTRAAGNRDSGPCRRNCLLRHPDGTFATLPDPADAQGWEVHGIDTELAAPATPCGLRPPSCGPHRSHCLIQASAPTPPNAHAVSLM